MKFYFKHINKEQIFDNFIYLEYAPFYFAYFCFIFRILYIFDTPHAQKLCL